MATTKKVLYVLAAVGTLALAACSSKVQTVNYIAGNEQQLYQQATSDVLNDKLSKANTVLTQLSLQYPFGQFADNVQVLQAYTNYKSGNYELATVTTDKYLKSASSASPYTDYMLLIHALASVETNRGFFQNLFNVNPANVDLHNIESAIVDLRNLIGNYANSPYLAYAKTLNTYLTQRVAEHNYNVAKFYLKYNDPLAAYKRANLVIINFPETEYAHQSLDILRQAVAQLKLPHFDAELRQIQKNVLNVKVQPNVKSFPKPGNEIVPQFILELKAQQQDAKKK